MFDYPAEQRILSKIIPGVAFTIFAPSYARRMAFDAAIAEFKSETRLINRQFQRLKDQVEELRRPWAHAGGEKKCKDLQALIEETQDAEELTLLNEQLSDAQFKLPPEISDELEALNERSNLLLVTKHNAPRVRVYCKSVEGLQVLGKEATIDTLLSDGPPELFVEILDAIDTVSEASEELIKNLQLPSTSSDQVVGKTTSTIAPSASEPAGTSGGIAVVTSPTK